MDNKTRLKRLKGFERKTCRDNENSMDDETALGPRHRFNDDDYSILHTQLIRKLDALYVVGAP